MGAADIRAAFGAAAARERAATIPYLVCGRPTSDAFPALVRDVVDAGADIVELGVPFSDPLADGTTIRAATGRALAAGIDVAGCLEMVRQIRALGVKVPLVLMGYVNPLLSYGTERFCADATAAGADGLIVPDVPLEEAGELCASAAHHGLGMTFLATPLTSDARIAELAAASTGFLYAVASTGTTGARPDVAASAYGLLARARALARGVPIAVGFGVSIPTHVAELAPHADGVIVGSALVATVERDPSVVTAFVAELAAATARPIRTP